MASRVALSATFSSLQVRNFRLYFVGQFVSVAGNWTQNVALGWLVLELSGSGTVLGMTMASRYLPLVLLGPWGGLMADRHNRRMVLGVTNIASGLFSLVIGILVAVDRISIGLLLVLTLLLGVVSVFAAPARQSIVNDLVPDDKVANAITLNSIAANAARLLGPAFAGILIAVFGLAPCFFFNAASFSVVVCSLLMMRGSELRPITTTMRSPGQIRDGLRYARDDRAVRSPLIMVAIVGVFTWEFQVTLPLMASSAFDRGSSAYGAMLSFLGLGAIIGGLIEARRQNTTPTSLSRSAIAWGISMLVASAAPTLPVAFILLFIVGAATISFNSQSKTIIQLSADRHMRGRVMALWFIAWQGSTVVGAPVVGWIGEHVGARYSLATGGFAALLVGAYYFVVSRKGQAERAHPGHYKRRRDPRETTL